MNSVSGLRRKAIIYLACNCNVVKEEENQTRSGTLVLSGSALTDSHINHARI